MLPRYQQLYESLRQQILAGSLAPGTRLPSSRVLAKQLKISRNTAISALEQLCSEGYAAAKKNSGIYVLPTLPTNWDQSLHSQITQPLPLSRRGQQLFDDSRMNIRSGAFATGIPNLKQFPFSLWNRYISRYARNPRLNWQGYTQQGGLLALRKIIAESLRITRGIQCSPQQVLITRGTQFSLSITANLLTDLEDRIWLENPGYPGARAVFSVAGLKIVGQTVDAEGLSPQKKAWNKPPKLIYVTPSHQYPLGVVMSAARRRQLLAQAALHKSWLLEDDYDSEFRYAGAPLAALQALSPNQVIYLGTFSKTLFPALQIGYMVLPEHLVEPFRTYQARHHREPAYVVQNALHDFICDGHYSAHLRKMRQIYHYRKKLLISLGQEYLGTDFQFNVSDTGLHLTILLPSDINDLIIEAEASRAGVVVNALSHYCLPGTPKSQKQSGLVLGFGDVSENNLQRAGKILMSILRKKF